MATAGAVLAVIRAARPNLKTATERVAFAVHAAFLAAGYSPVAIGSSANSSAKEGVEEREVGLEGWNGMDGAYAFRYSGADQPGLCKSVTVKCMAMGDSLMVDAAPDDAENPLHLELKVNNYAVEGDCDNYARQYKNLDGLVNGLSFCLLSKRSPPTEKVNTTMTSSPPLRPVEPGPVRPSYMGGPIHDDVQPFAPGFVSPLVPGFGRGDPHPSPGAGIFPRRDGAGFDGMLLGPTDARWGHVGGVRPPGFPGSIPGVPPGARFDPIGPPDVPGFEPTRFTRDMQQPPGTHPDLEHFSPDF